MIPAIKILHEGPESYDNMWQKSRSIWKYIYTHYIDKFDFFLMGGDDMLYIIENLQHYLQSEEIATLITNTNGLFLGRRFWPGKFL
jgi:glycoprotein-N-acetylgalactosamine 3-beta-galactosyltransferase